MDNNQNKQDNPKVERSPDKIIEYVNHYYPILSDEGRMKVCIDVVRREQAARIAELEAENARFREALENISSATDGNNPGHAVFYFEARKALNHKDKENG